MNISNSSQRLKDMIEKAIEDHQLTLAEYEAIIHIATKDGQIDRQERVLLEQLQDMIENKTVQFKAK